MVLLAQDTNRNGVLDLGIDTDLQSADICNGAVGEKGDKGDKGDTGADGKDGVDGQDAPVTPFSAVTIIDPCGDKAGIYDEILLKLADGSILASFSDDANGKNTRFSLLSPGDFVVTDGSKCYFTIDSNGNIINEHY